MLAVWLHFQVFQSIFRRRLTMIWTLHIRKKASRLVFYLKRMFTSLLWCCCIAFFRCFSCLLKRWQTCALVYPEWTRVALAWYFLVNDKAVNFPTLEDLFQLDTCASIQSIFDVSEILCLASVLARPVKNIQSCSPDPLEFSWQFVQSLSRWMKNLQPDLQGKGLKEHSIQQCLNHIWCFTIQNNDTTTSVFIHMYLSLRRNNRWMFHVVSL